MGGSGVAGPAKEQLGASRQRSSREREPADKGAEPRDPRVATIQGWPLSKFGHYYPRVATIEESGKWQLLSKALLGSIIREATWTLSSQGDQRAPIKNLSIDVWHIVALELEWLLRTQESLYIARQSIFVAIWAQA